MVLRWLKLNLDPSRRIMDDFQQIQPAGFQAPDRRHGRAETEQRIPRRSFGYAGARARKLRGNSASKRESDVQLSGSAGCSLAAFWTDSRPRTAASEGRR